MSTNSPQPLPANQQDPYSAASLIVGILALILGLFCGLLGVPAGLVAIYLGIQGRKRLEAIGRPTGVPTAGIALGAVAILATLGFLAATMIFGIGTT